MQDFSERKTYLLDDIEVVLTGRTATRKLKRDRTDKRHEVTPSDNTSGSWKKWVRMTDLYEIV